MKKPNADGEPTFYLVYYPPDFSGEEEARRHFDDFWARLLHDNPRAVAAAGGDPSIRPEQAIPGGGAVFINEWRLVSSMTPVDFTLYEVGANSPTGDGRALAACPECGKAAYYENLPIPFPPHFYIHRMRIDDGESKDTAGCFAERGPGGE